MIHTMDRAASLYPTDMRSRLTLLASLLSLALALSGCMFGPNYRRPEIETMEKYRFGEKVARDIADTAWWEQFGDPVLNEMIRIALVENKDIRIATARIEEFQGRYGVTRSELFPQIG